MKCIWLGQAGILFDFDGTIVIADPYLSNSAVTLDSIYDRRIPVNTSFFDIKMDVLILSHEHIDHTDPETLDILMKNKQGICVLASRNSWKLVRKYGNKHNYVMLEPESEWTYKDIHFQSVHAQHSDESAIGVLITYKNKTYYVTGDTLYSSKVVRDVKNSGREIDVVFLPINGAGNNMNMMDAARFAKAIGAKQVVPIHFGLMDSIQPEDFVCENKVIPEIYKEIPIRV